MSVLTPQQVYQVAEMAFGDLGPEAVDTMARIALAESGGNTEAYNGAGLDNSYGLWQVNVHPEANPDLAGYDLTDPIQNALAARTILDRQGPQAWSTYTSGAYLSGGGGGGGGYMPGQESDSWDGAWWQELWDTDDGTDAPADSPYAPSGPTLTQNDIGPLLEQRGYTYVSGWGPTAQWRGKDDKGNTATFLEAQLANSLFESLSPYAPQKAAGSGFTLGQNQTRYDASGRPIASTVASADPRLQQIWDQDYRNRVTIDNFLQLQLEFATKYGTQKDIASARDAIMSNNLKMVQAQQASQRLAMDAQKFQFDMADRITSRRADLASKIGGLARDAGDRGEYASFLQAMPFWSGQQEESLAGGKTFQTKDSLLPLEELLRTQQEFNKQFPQQPTSGLSVLPGQPVGLPAGMTTAASSKAPPETFPVVEPPPADGQEPLPQKAEGGHVQGAYISGEAGPELNIPIGKGRAVVLNEQQMDALGINLSRVMKMAGGGIFDGLVKDDDRSMASGFIADAFNRAKSGTPWEAFDRAPTPLELSTPGIDPTLIDLGAALAGLQRGQPASSFKRQAAMLTPEGINEGVIRRSA